ncbi:MAG: hypothetical protein WCF86_12500, partial [Pseudolabrys sp.]
SDGPDRHPTRCGGGQQRSAETAIVMCAGSPGPATNVCVRAHWASLAISGDGERWTLINSLPIYARRFIRAAASAPA